MLPTNTPTPTPVPTAVPQISPTPMSATLATFENGAWLIQNRPSLATSIVAIDWIADGIEASESEAVQDLVNLAAFHEMLTASLIGLQWFADGVAETETEGLEYFRYLATDSEAAASQVVNMPWFVDGITETEVGAIDSLAYIAQSSEAVAELVVDISWFIEGITETEREGLEYLSHLAYDSEAAASQVVNMPWFSDGITKTELEGLKYLSYIAYDSEVTARQVADVPWFVDGITEMEVEAVRHLGYIANDNTVAAERIVKMPFLTAIEPVDVSALDALSGLAGYREESLEQILAHPSLAAGITDALTPIVAMLNGVARTNPTLTDTLLDPDSVNLERRSIVLPLTGDIDLVIVRTGPGAARSMDLLEHSVRAAEELMGKPLPTRYVGLLFEDAAKGGFAGTNFDTHIAILPEYDVDDGSHKAEFAPHLIAHEVAHYYWSGNADWVDEGVSDFVASSVENKRTGKSIGVTNDPCAYMRSIAEMEALAPDPDSDDEFGCNYSLGERLFADMFRAIGEDAIWQGLHELYVKSLVEDDVDDLKGTALNIEHLREAFQSALGAAVAIGRWYEGTESYDLSQLDKDPANPTLPSINGRIDEAYIQIGENGPKESSFSAQNVGENAVWLNLDYSYNVTGGPHNVLLRFCRIL